jgi:hypothetical protein
MPIAVSSSADDLLRFLAKPDDSWKKAWADWESQPPPDDLVISNSVDELARALIWKAGNPVAARAAIKRAAQGTKKPRGQPSKNTLMLLIANDIREKKRLSDHAALWEIARGLRDGYDEQDKLVHVLQRKLRDEGKKLGKSRLTLASFSRRYDFRRRVAKLGTLIPKSTD